MAAIGLAYDRMQGHLEATDEDRKATEQSRRKKEKATEREEKRSKRQLEADGGEK